MVDRFMVMSPCLYCGPQSVLLSSNISKLLHEFFSFSYPQLAGGAMADKWGIRC
jgi:hypothetical protein